MLLYELNVLYKFYVSPDAHVVVVLDLVIDICKDI